MLRGSTAPASQRNIQNCLQIKDPVEQAFMISLQSAEAYVRLEQDLGVLLAEGGDEGKGDLSEEGFHDLLEPFCRACWQECERSFVQPSKTSGDSTNSFFAAARSEVQKLKKQLDECNLSAMKQVTALHAGSHSDGDLGEDTIQFYEPLQHLDPEVKELVLLITGDKVRQIAEGGAPNSLVAEICQAVEASAKKRRNSTGGGDVEELEEEVEELKDRLEAQEEKARSTQALKEHAEQRAREADNRLAEAQNECRQLQAEAERLQAETAQLRLELGQAKEGLNQANALLEEAAQVEAELREELRVAGVELRLANEKADQLSRDIEREREANAMLKVEVEKGQKAMEQVVELQAELDKEKAGAAEARRRAEELEAARRELQTKAMKLEQEVTDLREEIEELKRKPATRNFSSQSTLTGGQIDDLDAENKRLKLALEELRAKLGELMTECKTKGGMSTEVMDSIADSVGLRPILKARSCFERLYEDAMHRVERLEKLRDKYRHEKERNAGLGRNALASHNMIAEQQLESNSHSPVKPQLGVLEAVQQSTLSDAWIPPPQPARRLVSYPGSPTRSARELVEPTACPTTDRAVSTVQRSQALRAQSHAQASSPPPPPPQAPEPPDAAAATALSADPPLQRSVPHQSGLLPSSCLGGASPSAPARGGPARAPPVIGASPQPSGARVTFAPSSQDAGLELGQDVSRRLAASSSLPSLGRSGQQSRKWFEGTGTGSNAALMPRHGLGLIGGGSRDAGWR